MKISFWTAIYLLTLIFILFSCSQERAPGTPSGPGISVPEASSGTAVTPAWEKAWQNTINLARKENRLTGYSSLAGPVRVAMSEEFQKAFGIPIDWLAGSSAAITEKLVTERRNGLYLPDVYVGGNTNLVITLKPIGALDPLDPVIVPEIVEPGKWPEDKIPFLDRDHKIIGFAFMIGAPVLINTNLVIKGELKTFHDLLNPKWKGKIIMHDPTITGSGGKWFYMAGVKQLGVEFLRELVKQEPLITRDQRLQGEWIARGKYAIGIAPKIGVTVELIEAGAPIEEINVEPEYGTTSGGNTALINRAPHPNAARLFINWLLTKEGQTIFMRTNGSPSRRLDVSSEGLTLSPARVIKPGKQYFQSDNEDIILEEAEKGYQLAKEIFAPLLK